MQTDYIGLKLSETPEGTVAVVATQNKGLGSSNLIHHGGNAYIAYMGDDGEWDRCLPSVASQWLDCPVLHIIKLGEERPRTLGDDSSAVVWRGQQGKLYYTYAGKLYIFTKQIGCFVQQIGVNPSDVAIGPDWTCLGLITGIEIAGKVWRGEPSDV